MTQKEPTDDIVQRPPVMSLPVGVARLKSLGEIVKGEADEGMREELRQRLNILKVSAFSVEARVLPWKKSGVRIEGQIRGTVEQSCVVTLVPIIEHIDEAFTVTLLPVGHPYARKTDDNVAGGEMIINPDAEDPPEEFEGEEIDVGYYAEEFFALALDDYPRAKDAHFTGHIEDQGGPDSADNPFSALAGLKQQLTKDQEK
ncbi:YceD family protein [Cohaesibacter celericrescens]|uniref:YceD family protein n=1 Tax=Cohaesibacter celericrescens TaxID=2067669 RepID=UPI0035630726